jgi:DNA-directed DNA polymerase III PolC
MIHSGYSFRAAVGHLPQIINRLKTIGWQTAPIADRCSTFGFARWTKLAVEHGLRPVYGVELGVTPSVAEEKSPVDFWTFLAIDSLVPLHELIELATTVAEKRSPRLTYAQAHAATGLIKISGHKCLLDYVNKDDANFYLGLTPATSKGLLTSALRLGLRPCAASCNAYPTPEDREFYRITLTKFNKTKGRAFTPDVQTYPQHILSDDEWRAACHVANMANMADVAIDTRQRVLSGCKAELPKATLLKPPHPATLREMCEAGAKVLQCDLTDPVYAARMDRELKMIEEKNFADYFYIIADMVAYAKRHMIVGPARGSSAGSLVCYLLGITAIDPIPYGLLFERFLDITRTDLPDIDIDFSDERRKDVFEYAEKKYGEERVARLGTVGMFQPRSALKQAAINLRVPQRMLEKVFDSLLLRSSGDTRANQQIEDTLRDTPAGKELITEYPEIVVAAKMEDHPNNPSQHAAGIVLTQDAVKNYVAVDARTKSAMCDKFDAKELNLLKIDALGLTQLSVFERCLQLIGQQDKSIGRFLENIPLDDEAAFAVLNQGHFAGVFQFMGITLQSLTKQIKVESLNDIIAITALARPGPMATGGSGTWSRRRSGNEQVTYPHPLLEPYLRETLGVVVYQETVMQIGREIGDLSWKEVTALRKAMSQSLGQEYFDQFGDKWKAAAIKKGIPKEVANKFWFDMCAFGSWGFNKSHAVAYGLVSYWCCWLKAHHPLEFAAASLDSESKGGDIRVARQIQMLRELRDEGVDYIPVDRDHSTDKWMPITRNGKKLLLGPLSNIDGIGPKAVEEIIQVRQRGYTNGELGTAIKKKLDAGKTTIDTLEPIATRLRELYPDGLETANIVSRPQPIKNVQPDGGWQRNVFIIGVLRKMNLRDENEHVNVEKRGYRYEDGDTNSLLMFFKDDTDEMYVKITRKKFELMGREIFERGRVGKAIYAIKGYVSPDFRGLYPERIKYLGDMKEGVTTDRPGGTGSGVTNNTGLEQVAS